MSTSCPVPEMNSRWTPKIRSLKKGKGRKEKQKKKKRRNNKKLKSKDFFVLKIQSRDFPGGTVVKNPPANAGDTGSSPGPGRSHMPQSN